ncbi:hypothetical protein [Roseateles terrae]|uniref:Uncharacterized protein n=1 Tax=Roseateles terrae TaxID=431060 RepID=A0ABR6GNN6_9BURK|nr:hypothetical protein [Roseateles terrae]MBB3193675.1 hypothetical protein [Roseateles terrae]OWQ89165.1 hypothetical protein CDN98_01015 [Roseateles terrae]
MKLDRTRQSAEAQQAAGTQDTQRHRQGQGGASGYAGGMHKGVAYRHAPRAHLPAKRNTGPAPRARARPASTAAAGAHHDEEHPRSLADDPWAQAGGGGAGAGSLLGGVSGQKTVSGLRGGDGRGPSQHTAATTGDAPAPPPPLRQPPVREGAALRRSKRPEAELLRTPPREGQPLTRAALLNAFAALYFQGGAQPAGALRLAAKAALAQHLKVGTPPMTLAEVRSTAIAWCETHGRPPALTEAQKNANVLFPLEAFRALSGPRNKGVGPQPALPLATLLQRALEHHTASKETSR